jgi:hypothetical protein
MPLPGRHTQANPSLLINRRHMRSLAAADKYRFGRLTKVWAGSVVILHQPDAGANFLGPFSLCAPRPFTLDRGTPFYRDGINESCLTDQPQVLTGGSGTRCTTMVAFTGLVKAVLYLFYAAVAVLCG